MEITINNKNFEWDEEKARSNKIKHGVSFKYAAKVFEDENRVEFEDDVHSKSEQRIQVIGKVDEVLFVVYCNRDENIRLISARKANRFEKEVYYSGF